MRRWPAAPPPSAGREVGPDAILKACLEVETPCTVWFEPAAAAPPPRGGQSHRPRGARVSFFTGTRRTPPFGLVGEFLLPARPTTHPGADVRAAAPRVRWPKRWRVERRQTSWRVRGGLGAPTQTADPNRHVLPGPLIERTDTREKIGLCRSPSRWPPTASRARPRRPAAGPANLAGAGRHPRGVGRAVRARVLRCMRSGPSDRGLRWPCDPNNSLPGPDESRPNGAGRHGSRPRSWTCSPLSSEIGPWPLRAWSRHSPSRSWPQVCETGPPSCTRPEIRGIRADETPPFPRRPRPTRTPGCLFAANPRTLYGKEDGWSPHPPVRRPRETWTGNLPRPWARFPAALAISRRSRSSPTTAPGAPGRSAPPHDADCPSHPASVPPVAGGPHP